MKRRSFLQGTGVFLAAWGAGGLSLPFDRHAQVLAQSTPRKLALLIGINQYRNANLNGCVTDVELQRELLIHRFGFQPSDIVSIVDHHATRSSIERAFTEHLIQQAKPGDVVIVHFSGHGSLQKLGATTDDVQPVWLTVDDPSDQINTNGLSQDTLFLLLRSLATDQITTVLDTGYVYSGYPLQGNLRVRSRPMEAASRLTDAEIAFQERLLAKLALDRSQVRAQWRSERMPGVLLAAANAQQFATEAPWNGFNAGIFTYVLTQQLWQAIPNTTLRICLRRTAELMGKRVDQKQQPTLGGQKSGDRPLKPYQLPFTQPPAEGVIRSIEDGGKLVDLWLGGIPPQVLEQYSTNSLFTVEMANSHPLPLLQIYERNGLTAKARFVATEATPSPALTIGQPIQEAVRVLPRNLGLTVAIDSNLERIERVDAVSAFSAMPRISATIAGEQAADYVFGKLRQPTQVAALSTNAIAGTIPPAGYGLFSQGRDALPRTTGESGEAVKVAIRRLAPCLQTLLGAKLLNLTTNEGSSQLGVRVTLTALSPDRILTQQKTERVSSETNSAVLADGKLLTIPVGTRIQYRIDNTSEQPIYFIVLGLDNNGNSFVFNNFGNMINSTSSNGQSNALPPQPTQVAPNETAFVPMIAPNVEWLLQAPSGLAETYVICSRMPFQQTRSLISSTAGSNPLLALNNFLEVAQSVLQDLHQASEQAAQWVGTPDVFALDMNDWATFRFAYQVTV